MPRTCMALIAVAMALAAIGGEAQPAAGEETEIEIQLVRDAETQVTTGFEVRGLTGDVLADLGKLAAEDSAWREIFAVYVAEGKEKAGVPLFGTCHVHENTLEFRARFPLREGTSYRAVYRPAAIPGGEGEECVAVRRVPRRSAQALLPAEVTRVYPTTKVLPENQLKFYVHFSAPMARGEAYDRVHLLRADGGEVDMPFLEIGQELWDPSGTRLTLLFDPGRIKRGLKPREEEGPALEEGKSYLLVIDSEWPDAAGGTLTKEHRKQFTVAAPDDVQPDAARWKIAPPTAGTRAPLIVTFPEPLDAGMLRRVLAVRRGADQFVAGEIELAQQETEWRFIPAQTWHPGPHALVVDKTLEDLAGNSLGRPFEVDVVRETERKVESMTIELPFSIADP